MIGPRVRPTQVLLGLVLICLTLSVGLLIFRVQANTRESSEEFRRLSLSVTTLANVQREVLLLHSEVLRIAAGKSDLKELKLRRQLLERQLDILDGWKVPQRHLRPINRAASRLNLYADRLSESVSSRDRDVIVSEMVVLSEGLEQEVKDLYDAYEQRFFPELGRKLQGGAESQRTLLMLGIVVIVIALTLGLLIRRSVASDFRTAYELLSQLEHRYRNLVEKAPAVVYAAEFGTNGRWHYVSPQIESLLGFTPDEWMADPELWYRQLHPEDRDGAIEQEQLAMVGRGRLRNEYRMLTRRGDVVWVRDEAVVVAGDNGLPALLEGLMIDITETKISQKESEVSLSLLQATLEATADGILVVSTEGEIVNLNEIFVDMWGLPEEVVASGDDERALAVAMDRLKDPDEFLAKVKDLYSRPEAESFDVIEFKDGRVLERLSKPQRLGGDIVGRVWSFRDVSERVRAEEERQRLEQQLNQSQKMEAVGQLAGGIAHDFNNLLAVVINYAQLAADEVETSSQLRRDLEEILSAGQRGATLTRQLLTFSRRGETEPEVVSLNEVVADMNGLLSRMIPETIQVRTELDPDLNHSRVDPAQFEQVLMNLAINARDAMPDGGKLTIATRNLSVEQSPERELDLVPGDYVVLDVGDTGHGIPEDLLPRIFEPFFTTKSIGEGTGLGLAVVYGIVKNAGGEIFVTSRSGEGSHFRVFLPAVDAIPGAREAAADDRVARPNRSRGQTILVVEDEAPVRVVLERILSEAGYGVFAHGSPTEALREHMRHPGDIDLLLTDVVMPELSGGELAKKTGLPTVFMSGYAESLLPEIETLRTEGRFIDKPFTRERLLEVIDAAIDQLSKVREPEAFKCRVTEVAR